MPAQRAKGRHLVDQIIGRIRQFLPPQVKTEDPIDAACNGAHIVTGGRQSQSAFCNDSATTAVVREQVETGIHGRHVERPEKVAARRLERAFDGDGGR